jgi:PST family polysaccharide transporter
VTDRPELVPVEGALVPERRGVSSALRAAAASQVGRQIIQFATTAILARLVAPSEFGLIGMAVIAIAFVTLFRDLGTASALIRARHASPALTSTIFWLNVAIGCLLGASMWLVAPLVASAFGEPRVEPILRVMAITPVISNVGLVHQVLLERALRFDLLLRVEVGSSLAGGIVGVGLALVGAGVWSLVAQAVTHVAVSAGGLWIASGFRPSRMFRASELRSVARFSLGVSGYSLVNYLNRNADYILIGRFLGAEQLGFYTLAYRLMLYPLQHISQVAGRVMYPVLSRVREDDAEFRRLYLRASGGIAMLTLPVVFGLMATTGPLVLTLLGPRWEPVIPVLTVLAPVALVQTVGAMTGVIYQATGRSDALLAWGVGSSVVIVGGFAVGLQWGIIGVAAAYLVVTLALAYPLFAIPFRFVGLAVRDLIATVARPFLISLAMFVLVFLLARLLPATLGASGVLAVLVAAGATFYALASWVFDRDRVRQALAMFGAGARVTG